MKIIHNNNGLFGGYHYRVVKTINADHTTTYKIQEIKEGIEKRYRTIAQMPGIQYRAEIFNIDLDNPAALYKWAMKLKDLTC